MFLAHLQIVAVHVLFLLVPDGLLEALLLSLGLLILLLHVLNIALQGVNPMPELLHLAIRMINTKIKGQQM